MKIGVALGWWGCVLWSAGAALAQPVVPTSAPPSVPASGPAAAPGSAPASAADLGPQVPDTPQARAILKRVKTVERSGYERRDLKRYLGAFSPEAEVVVARLEAAGPYDRRYDFASWSTLKRRETAGPPHKLDLLFFRSPALTVEGTTARLEIDMRVDFFGGYRVNRMRYELEQHLTRALPKAEKPGHGAGERPEDWRIRSVRIWPLSEQISGEPIQFSPEYWARQDQRIAEPGEGSADELVVMARYLFAWRFREAEGILKTLVAEKPARADAWLALTQVRLELGDFEGARQAFAETLQRNPQATVPMLLAQDFPKARRAP